MGSSICSAAHCSVSATSRPDDIQSHMEKYLLDAQAAPPPPPPAPAPAGAGLVRVSRSADYRPDDDGDPRRRDHDHHDHDDDAGDAGDGGRCSGVGGGHVTSPAIHQHDVKPLHSLNADGIKPPRPPPLTSYYMGH